MNTNEFTVYTMTGCPFCVKAKELLKRERVAFNEVKLDENDDAAWERLEKKSGLKTMPQIFRGDILIGGYDALHSLWAEGKLKFVA